MVYAGADIDVSEMNLALSPYLALVTNASQSIPDATTTTVTYATESLDTDGLYDAGTPNRFTITHAGVYVAYASAFLASSADYRRHFLAFAINGSETIRLEQRDNTSFYGGGLAISSGLMDLSASDYVQVQAYQDNTSSAARDLTTIRFSILYVSDGS